MARDSDGTMDRVEVITSVERRRRWSHSEKERWVRALREPGANVSALARQAGVSPSYLYRWRRELRGAGKSAQFVPVAIAAPESVCIAGPAAITIDFACGARVRIEGAPDGETLTRVVGALSAPARRVGGDERAER